MTRVGSPKLLEKHCQGFGPWLVPESYPIGQQVRQGTWKSWELQRWYIGGSSDFSKIWRWWVVHWRACQVERWSESFCSLHELVPGGAEGITSDREVDDELSCFTGEARFQVVHFLNRRQFWMRAHHGGEDFMKRPPLLVVPWEGHELQFREGPSRRRWRMCEGDISKSMPRKRECRFKVVAEGEQVGESFSVVTNADIEIPRGEIFVGEKSFEFSFTEAFMRSLEFRPIRFQELQPCHDVLFTRVFCQLRDFVENLLDIVHSTFLTSDV